MKQKIREKSLGLLMALCMVAMTVSSVPAAMEGEEPETFVEEEVSQSDVFTDGDGTEEMDFTFLNEDNTSFLSGESEEDQQLVEEIQTGEMVAFAPVAIDVAQLRKATVASSDDEISLLAANELNYTITTESRLYCDEVWTQANDEAGRRKGSRYRLLNYYDYKGRQRQSILYCLEASKAGGLTTTTDVSVGDAYSVLKNSTIRKLLYFGYKGPGDICSTYDPTCSHIDWSKSNNRFIFTHVALSKEYSGDTGGATQAELNETGVQRFYDKIKRMTIPSYKGVEFKIDNDCTGNWISDNPNSSDMVLYKTAPPECSTWLWAKYRKSGFMISHPIVINDTSGSGNRIIVTGSGSEAYQIVYWSSMTAYRNNGFNKCSVVPDDGLAKLPSGTVLAFITSASAVKPLNLSYTMTAAPVSYLFVDGQQLTGKDTQDMGAAVYQGTPGVARLTLNPAVPGSVLVIKRSSEDGKFVQGAKYGLYAAQDIYSANVKLYAQNELIQTMTTNTEGKASYPNLLPGKYYIKETAAASGFLLDTQIYNLTVTGGKKAVLEVKDDPDRKGSISIKKVIAGTQLVLSDAEFTITEWKEENQSYSGTVRKMPYNAATLCYESGELVYSGSNKGKFYVEETRNPKGFTGSWSKEFVLSGAGSSNVFHEVVENEEITKKFISIRKTDAVTGVGLTGAEFTLYEWSEVAHAYSAAGRLLTYNSTSKRYVSDVLEVTDGNKGRFLVKETRNPQGYTGGWSAEIDIKNEDANLQYEVKNNPIAENPKGTITLEKKDSITGGKLAGAEFVIYQWNKNISRYENTLGKNAVMTYDSTALNYKSQPLEITELNQGRFKVSETKNPSGYTGSFTKEVVLTESTGNILLTAVNEPDKAPYGEILVTKKVKESDITWAHGNPVFTFVVKGTDIKGKKHQYEKYVRFSPNAYQVDTNGYAFLTVRFKNIPLGSYQVYEKQVLRYYLKQASADTSNMNIVKVSEGAYGKAPKDTAYGVASLTQAAKTAGITFVNEKRRYDDYSHTAIVKNNISLLFE